MPKTDNEGSLFVKLEVEGSKALFTGDASASVEARAISTEINWKADVMLPATTEARAPHQ